MRKNEIVSKALRCFCGPNNPGLQYVVVNKDSTVYEQSAGFADISNSILMSLDHTMSAFSMTKTLTAIAVLQLIEQHLIKLDDKISDYIRHPYDSEITVRQLLNHTSGIPSPIPLRWVHLEENHTYFNEQEALSHVLKKYPNAKSKPDEEYRYSNIGYWLLGGLIENVSKIKFERYMTEHIFEPLSLTPKEISCQIVDEREHAKGYLKKWSAMNFFGRIFIDRNVLGNYEGNWLHIKNVYVNGPSFGGVIGSSRAFGRILQDLLSIQSKLLNRSSMKLLYLPQKVGTGKAINMTLGWHIGQLNGQTYFFKEGGGAGFRCEMRIYPANGLASVLMANRTSLDTRKKMSTRDRRFIENGGCL